MEQRSVFNILEECDIMTRLPSFRSTSIKVAAYAVLFLLF